MIRPSRSLTEAHWRRLTAIRARLTDTIVADWRRTGFDDADVPATVERVLNGQRAIVAAVDADLAAITAVTTRTRSDPIGVNPEPLIGRTARNGVLLEEIYSRPRVAARRSGFDQGIQYLRHAINVDSQLAQRRAAHAIVIADRRIVGWRRQVNPGGGSTCGLCVAAASNTYGKQDLLPIHPMCRCSVYPVYATDPVSGSVLDRDRLQAVYDRSEGRTSRLGPIRFTADELPAGVDSEAIRALGPRVAWHPEIGEYLTGARHDTSFTF